MSVRLPSFTLRENIVPKIEKIKTFDTPTDNRLCPKLDIPRQNLETFDDDSISKTFSCEYDYILVKLNIAKDFNLNNNEQLNILKDLFHKQGQDIVKYLNQLLRSRYYCEYAIDFDNKPQVEKFAKWFCTVNNNYFDICKNYIRLEDDIFKLEQSPKDDNVFIKKTFSDAISSYLKFKKFLKDPQDFQFPFKNDQLLLEIDFSNCNSREPDTGFSNGQISLEFCKDDSMELQTRTMEAFLSQLLDSETNKNSIRALALNLLSGKCTKEQLEINPKTLSLSLNTLNSTLLINFAAFVRENLSKSEIEQLLLSTNPELVDFFEKNKPAYKNFLDNLEDSCKKNPEGLDYPQIPVVPTTTEAPTTSKITTHHPFIPTPKNTILASKELITAILGHDNSFLRGYLNGKTTDQISAIVDPNNKSLLEIVLDNDCDIQTVLLLLTNGAYKNLDDFVSTKKLTLREFALSKCKNHNQIKNILELYPLEKNGVIYAIELNAFNPDLHNNPPEILNPVFPEVGTTIRPEALVIEAIIGALQGASLFYLEKFSKKLQEKYPAHKRAIHNIVHYPARLVASSMINLLRIPGIGPVTFLPKPQSSIATAGAYFAENLISGIPFLFIIELGQQASERLTDNDSYKKWIKLIFNYLFNLHCIAMIFTSEEFQNNPMQVSLGYGAYFAASLLTHLLLSQCVSNEQNRSSRSGRFSFFRSNDNATVQNSLEESHPLQARAFP